MREGVCGMKVTTTGDSRRSAGVSPAVAGVSRSRAKQASTSEKKGRSKLRLKSIRARAGCPRNSGRDARATSDVPSDIQAFLNFRNGTRTKM
jgi:hypothetical protein